MSVCPLFGGLVRFFSFIIDKKQPLLRLFLYTGESVRFSKNALCFAVKPSGWRFTFDASIFVTLFRRFAPSDSPRVHQWRCQATTPQLYLPFGKSDCFAVIFCFAKLNFHFVKVKANIISLWCKPKFHRQRRFHSFIFCVQNSFVFSPRKNRPKYGRFFVVWIYCFLLKNALLILLLFVEQCFDCGN